MKKEKASKSREAATPGKKERRRCRRPKESISLNVTGSSRKSKMKQVERIVSVNFGGSVPKVPKPSRRSRIGA